MALSNSYRDDFQECDPSQAGYLQDDPAAVRKRGGKTDSPWGLANYLSEVIPKKWGVFTGLDTSEKRHATKYMKALLEEHALPPERIRAMADAFAKKATNRKLPYPVGTFWAMRRELEEATAPVQQKDYAGWTAAAPSVSRDYSGWLQ